MGLIYLLFTFAQTTLEHCYAKKHNTTITVRTLHTYITVFITIVTPLLCRTDADICTPIQDSAPTL